MKKLFFLFTCLLFFISQRSFAQDKNISSGIYETEPFLAVNPANSQNLVAAWMKVTGLKQVTICSRASMDGGKTWGTATLLPHISKNFTSADVSLAFNKAGMAFICYIDYKLSFDSGYVK